MTQSPTNEKPVIVEVKVTGVEKRKAETKKNCEYVLRVAWSNETQYRLFRRYSMFFDLQAGLKQLFESKQNITMPVLAVCKTSHAGRMLFGANAKRQCKAIEEFCEKIRQLPAIVSQCDIVEKFFSQWATDALSNGDHEESSPVVLHRSLSHPTHGLKHDREDEDVVAERYHSVAQFVGTDGGEMSLEQHEVVSLIEKNQTGWWLVINSKGEHGFAPATFLEPVDSLQNTDTEEWTEILDNDRFWVTVQSYTAQSEDEISYDAGEEVELLATSNFGWWKIRYRGSVGLTPASHLGPRSVDNDVEPDYTECRNRLSTYSTASGIYASIKSPPPRRGSSKNKDKQNPGAPCQAPLQYADVEIATSPPRSPGHRESTAYTEVLPRHLRGLALPNLHIGNGSTGKKKMNGSPESPSPSSPCSSSITCIDTTALMNDSFTEYATVRDPTARGTQENIRLLGSLDGKHRYLNVQSSDSLDSSEAEYYTALMNYNPPADRLEDLALSVGTTVRRLSEDGPWFFVSAVHLPGHKGWVPSSVLKKKQDELSCLMPRRSFSVGDIMLACQEEEEANTKKTTRAPVPLPRKDIQHRSRMPSLELLDKSNNSSRPPSPDGPDSCAPPLPGEPIPTLERTQILTSPGTAKINARYISASNYFPTDPNCVSFRKGDCSVLLEVNKDGWWRMNIDGVEGWTPGHYWELYEEHDGQHDLTQKRRLKSNKSIDSESWFQGKITRQECEEQMIGNAGNLEFLVRESAQKFASYVLSVKYFERIRHFPIELTPSHRFVIGKHVFHSLAEIVTYYKEHALFYTRTKEPVYLGGAFRRL